MPVWLEGIPTTAVAFVLDTGTDIKAVELADVKALPVEIHVPDKEVHPLFNDVNAKLSTKEEKAFSLVCTTFLLADILRI